jgi:phage gpG-like protein
MTGISLKVQNVDAVMQAIRQYGAKAEAELSKAVNTTALTINTDIKKAIQSPPKTGVVYMRRGKKHQASAPGEAPATDTGTLVSSITYKQEIPLTATVSSRLDYAYYLEFGTRSIKPRPSWVPAVEKNTKLFNDLVDAALRRAAQ